MLNDHTLERALILKDAQRLYKLIGQNDFIDLILPNEIDKIVLKRKFQNNDTFENIAHSIGLTTMQTVRVYESAVKKIKSQIRKFIHHYISVKKTEIAQPHLKAIERTLEKIDKGLKNENTSLIKQSKSQDLLISDLMEKNIKWLGVLNNKGIYTVADLSKYSRRELLKIPGMGLNSVNEIEFLLNHYNLKLANPRIEKIIF